MAITVTMIEEKEFKTKVRGYDPVEVDEFLDAICDEMVDMQNTIHSLREQLKQRSEGPSGSFAPLPVPPVAPPPLSPFAPMREQAEAHEEEVLPADLETAKRLLEETQQSCDKVLSEARDRAQKIIEEAEEQVPDPELTDLEGQRDRMREEIEKLRKEAAEFRERFKSMLKDHEDILDTESELF